MCDPDICVLPIYVCHQELALICATITNLLRNKTVKVRLFVT